jgi:DNA-binding response OmpR family regulator
MLYFYKAMTCRILLVDDEAELLEALTEILTEHGFEVYSARNSEEFQEKALALKPDLIILDIMLGSANGPQVYEHLITLGFDPGIPVIFLSGLAQPEDVSPAQNGRKFALYGKPVRTQELIHGIRCLVNHR